tara:strand:- start:11760 stop:12290 length:531 start_codon:yes stop_codon:yes gene_type:complete
MPDYVIDGKIGVDLTATYVSTSATSALLPHTPGTIVSTTQNGRYVFARAESDIAAFDCVIFSTYADSASLTPILRANPITTTNAANTGYSMVGFAQTAISSSNYGWIALNGVVRVNLLVSCNPRVPLYTTSTAGKLDDTTVSAGYIQGVVANTSATSASAPFCIVNNAGLMTSNPV